MIIISTKLQKWGNSQAVRLPKSIMEAASFSENESVQLVADDFGIKIVRASPIYSLDDLFKNYEGTYICSEADTGFSIGEEVM